MHRSAITDNTPISVYEYNDKSGKKQISKFVLSISNWHFVRDSQLLKDCPTCYPKDCMVSLKFSSTTFKTLENAQEPAEIGYFFDRNGLAVPYAIFIYLLRHEQFTVDFCDLVKLEFENRGNQISWEDDEIDESVEIQQTQEERIDDDQIDPSEHLQQLEGAPLELSIDEEIEEDPEDEIVGQRKRKRGKTLDALTASTNKKTAKK